jgi:PPOX class probable FMN-dependent enzyme
MLAIGALMYIESKQQLRQLYASPKAHAIAKEVPVLDEIAMNFIRSSTLVVISTFDANGKVNVSPRGGETGFVKILADNQIIIPDAKGNNRIDSLMNIIDTGKIGCLFLVPNSNETLRLNGYAKISVHEQHLNLDFGLTKPPHSCIEITITDVFLHCSMSLSRSKIKLT